MSNEFKTVPVNGQSVTPNQDAERTWTVSQVLAEVDRASSAPNQPVGDNPSIQASSSTQQSSNATTGSGSATPESGTSTSSPNPSPRAVAAVRVNVGTPGNIRSINLDASKAWTVGEVLAQAQLSARGYDIRVNGQPANGASLVETGQTVLLLAPVRGNSGEGAITGNPAGDGDHQNINIKVGTPGNVRPLSLDGSRTWTVAEVLNIAELSASGYDLRVTGEPATGSSPVADGQTLLLLAPVRGN
jgi:hypothetical protein